jgi:type VI secretion system protein ImpH
MLSRKRLAVRFLMTDPLHDLPPGSVADRLFREPFAFGFFQAVRLLARLAPDRQPVGYWALPSAEVAHFRAHLSLSFPPSALFDLKPPAPRMPAPRMTVTFLGLTGPSGMLPRHYTELLLRLRDTKGPEKTALRDWFDLFNHRLISLFYRSWEKYRFYIPYERGDYAGHEPDTFTEALYSFIGMATGGLRNRLRVSQWEVRRDQQRERVLARIEDLSLLHYAGLLAHRPRNASDLEALLGGYFGMPVRVVQFSGQWMTLEPGNQSSLAGPEESSLLGVNVVAGERVWDVQGRIRLRVGPLDFGRFRELQPDRGAHPERKAFFLLLHLARLYIGAEMTFDVQLVLRAADVPECELSGDEDNGPRLGWNTWITSREPERDAEEVVFEGDEVLWINEAQRWTASPGEVSWTK